jgi:hypothetical protein
MLPWGGRTIKIAVAIPIWKAYEKTRANGLMDPFRKTGMHLIQERLGSSHIFDQEKFRKTFAIVMDWGGERVANG